jgi:hypothetical protein
VSAAEVSVCVLSLAWSGELLQGTRSLLILLVHAAPQGLRISLELSMALIKQL